MRNIAAWRYPTLLGLIVGILSSAAYIQGWPTWLGSLSMPVFLMFGGVILGRLRLVSYLSSWQLAFVNFLAYLSIHAMFKSRMLINPQVVELENQLDQIKEYGPLWEPLGAILCAAVAAVVLGLGVWGAATFTAGLVQREEAFD